MSRLVIILTTICLVAAAVLAGVYDLTKETIAEQQRLRTLRALKSVLPPFDNEIERGAKQVVTGKDRKGRDIVTTFYVARREGRLVGTAFQVVAPDGYSGNIYILMGVDPEFKVTGIEIISHLETPGLGDKIEDPEWRAEFKGRSLADGPRFAVKKDGGEIDQFTGATISPRAVVNAVKRGLALYEKLVKEGVLEGGGTSRASLKDTGEPRA